MRNDVRARCGTRRSSTARFSFVHNEFGAGKVGGGAYGDIAATGDGLQGNDTRQGKARKSPVRFNHYGLRAARRMGANETGDEAFKIRREQARNFRGVKEQRVFFQGEGRLSL